MSAPSLAAASTRRGQRGLGLIEVLVALVVVSLGVLGMAGLQLTGMKHSSGGFNRSKALLFAENMAVRMRVNEPGVLAGDYDGFDTDGWGGSCTAPPASYCQASMSAGSATEADSCDTGELADFDLWSVACGDWGTDADGDAVGEGVLGALPDGRLQVSCDAATCTMYTITVGWNEGSTTSTDPEALDPKRVQMRLRP